MLSVHTCFQVKLVLCASLTTKLQENLSGQSLKYCMHTVQRLPKVSSVGFKIWKTCSGSLKLVTYKCDNCTLLFSRDLVKQTFSNFQISSDPYVLILKDVITLVYVDDCILILRDNFCIQKIFDYLQKFSKFCMFTDEGTMNTYLAVVISPLPDGETFILS